MNSYSSGGSGTAVAIVVNYDGIGRPSPSMIILYNNYSGLFKARNAIGEQAFSIAWKQSIENLELLHAYNTVLSSGSPNKEAEYSLQVILVFEDSAPSKFHLNETAADVAFENIDNISGESAIHNLLRYLEAGNGG